MVLQEPRPLNIDPTLHTMVLSVLKALVACQHSKLFRNLLDLTGFVLHIDRSVVM